MAEWEEKNFGECAEFQEGYVNPPQGKAHFFGGHIKWLRAVDLNDGFVFDTSRKLTKAGFDSAGRSAKCFEPDTLAISKSGTIGRVGILRDYMCGNRAIINIRPKQEQCLTRFAFYALLLGRRQIETLAEGSVQKNLYVSSLSQFAFRCPPVAEQQKIVDVLSSLDDKIELNRRTNETLEAMAQAIFRDWFVDFGPVRRKIGGETDPVAVLGSLLPHPDSAAYIADLFPDAFGDNGLPEGWEREPVGKLAEIVGGSTPSTKDAAFWLEGTHAWATPKDLSKLEGLMLFETERCVSDSGLYRIASGLSPIGTVLLSSRAPVGYLAVAATELAVNQGIIAIRPTKKMPTAFALMWCKENMDIIEANANGSTFQEISKKNFRPLLVVSPSDDTKTAFSSLVKPLLDQIELNQRSSLTLGQTRDLLLPKLMSGEVRLQAVKDVVGGVD